MEQLKRKAVIVTGASGGMGKEVCKILAENYDVFALDIRPTNLNDIRITDVIADVTDNSSVEKAKEIIENSGKSIFSVIHTAGIYDLDSLIEMDEQRFTKIFNVNLFGVYRINKAFVSLIEKGGKIIKVKYFQELNLYENSKIFKRLRLYRGQAYCNSYRYVDFRAHALFAHGRQPHARRYFRHSFCYFLFLHDK